MMDELLRISIDEYVAVILLDKLPELPRQNIRKILKMLYSPRNYFRADTQYLSPAIDRHVQATKHAWEEASQQYTNGWKLVNKRSRTKESIEILAENRRLKNEVKRAKARYDRWAALQTINDEIKKGNCL